MLVSIAPRTDNAPPDLVQLLLECHRRIRTFLALERQAGTRRDVPRDEIVEACSRAERYFSEALPLHVQDEEDSILPRLRGRCRDIDRALETMHDEHTDHEAKIRALLRASSAVRQAPQDDGLRQSLAIAAADLERVLHAHLALEEAIVFPGIRRWLSSAVQAEIVGELRGRRGMAGAM